MAEYLDERKFNKQIEKNKIALFGKSFKDKTDRQLLDNGVHSIGLDKKMRKCMGCGVNFLSVSIENRQCDRCKRKIEYLDYIE